MSTEAFVDWWTSFAEDAYDSTSPNGSFIFFCGIGPASQHAADLLVGMRKTSWTFRNWITWSKRRGFGKVFDYVNAREEILWYSKNPARTEVTFNKPFTCEDSEFKKVFGGKENPNEKKRATTVWKDLPEPIRGGKPSGHYCEKPENVIERLVLTHSNPGDLVVDPFCGSGTIPAVAHRLGRHVYASDIDPKWADYTAARIQKGRG
jgi:DNA modification methylase